MSKKITLDKIDTGYYSVIISGSKIGEVIKVRRPGTGRQSRGYVGYVPPHSAWEFWPDDPDAGGYKDVYLWDDINKVEEVKNKLNEFFEGKLK